MFRVTSEKFTEPAVSHKGKHYFPYDGQVQMDERGRLSMPFCYYDRQRGEWKECTAYLSDMSLVEQLFTFAQKKGLIKGFPSVVTAFLNNNTVLANKAS
ncbi:hypothetical protein H735_10320 [Vibrio owensii CAIM 1854 = LMG 25443]|uniref:Uncharacterized protein n=5 Tax=Vibrionaceae TaxID=641 RepID=A0AAN0SGU9_9VIBR|nr:hypothetical protein [Vibrio coralliilyticus]KIF53309.1 hypothetical protein H735_10320 [Vibrio owensii CAIM 1854 = LMG 25443]POB47193.1 hypothetical protein CRN52_14025 [Vibrio vulnificus]CAH1588370.1 conserved hypothetical protein [Vibrio jasicida]AIW22379.1 hypothetical protein IX92_25245 [Vibrio coralliilyticus]PAW02450.1 hypothetical protein CKJ79_17450 [Vibrio coralliilyticus]